MIETTDMGQMKNLCYMQLTYLHLAYGIPLFSLDLELDASSVSLGLAGPLEPQSGVVDGPEIRKLIE